jgi:hypothetical protein
MVTPWVQYCARPDQAGCTRSNVYPDPIRIERRCPNCEQQVAAADAAAAQATAAQAAAAQAAQAQLQPAGQAAHPPNGYHAAGQGQPNGYYAAGQPAQNQPAPETQLGQPAPNGYYTH